MLMHLTYRIQVISMYLNSVDPDQLASQKPADLDQHCFLKQDIQALSYLVAQFVMSRIVVDLGV